MDQGDLEEHFDDVHYNPIKHGYGTRAADWPYSGFTRYLKGGLMNMIGQAGKTAG